VKHREVTRFHIWYLKTRRLLSFETNTRATGSNWLRALGPNCETPTLLRLHPNRLFESTAACVSHSTTRITSLSLKQKLHRR